MELKSLFKLIVLICLAALVNVSMTGCKISQGPISDVHSTIKSTRNDKRRRVRVTIEYGKTKGTNVFHREGASSFAVKLTHLSDNYHYVIQLDHIKVGQFNTTDKTVGTKDVVTYKSDGRASHSTSFLKKGNHRLTVQEFSPDGKRTGTIRQVYTIE